MKRLNNDSKIIIREAMEFAISVIDEYADSLDEKACAIKAIDSMIFATLPKQEYRFYNDYLRCYAYKKYHIDLYPNEEDF